MLKIQVIKIQIQNSVQLHHQAVSTIKILVEVLEAQLSDGAHA
jgi:hypothetical protein